MFILGDGSSFGGHGEVPVVCRAREVRVRSGKNMILDLGCGSNKAPSAIGVDILYHADVDIVSRVDLLPIADGVVDQVYASHILEHVSGLVNAMEEIWRVCKPGARVHVWAPHFSCGLYIWSDPTHVRGMSTCMFDYFDPIAPYPVKSGATFQVIRRELHFGFRRNVNDVIPMSRWTALAKRCIARIVEPVANLNRVSQLLCERSWAQLVGFEEVYFELRVVKSE